MTLNGSESKREWRLAGASETTSEWPPLGAERRAPGGVTGAELESVARRFDDEGGPPEAELSGTLGTDGARFSMD